MNNATAPRPPLHGVRVLDLSTVVAGPFGSEILGQLGAEVIRIDPPPKAPAVLAEGDEGSPTSDTEGFTWALQRNKRSLCLDLKAAPGKAAFLEGVRRSDVVWDNFRPGVLARLGLDAAALRAVNPRIVCCSISGFGADGPWATVAAYDAVVQALGGSMGITGTGEPGDIPCRLGVPIGDIGGALYGVIGVVAALLARQRSGQGAALDISLLDVQLAMNTYRVPQVFGSGIDFGVPSPRRGGAGATPYGPYRCADAAWIVLGVASNFWPAFCQTLGCTEWLVDARFATLVDRQANQAALEALVEQRLSSDTAQRWEERLTAAGVPAARVNQIHEAFDHPQARARGALVAFRQPRGRVIQVADSPLRWVGEPALPQRPPVAVGADTDAILAELARPVLPTPGQPAQPSKPDSAVAALATQVGPLAGTLVLEFCGDEPSGTLGTQILADLGATVLKIERTPADDPPPVVPMAEGQVPRSVAYAFGLNRNKRSLAIDLKHPEGHALALRLAARADVVLDNHKPGALQRLGLGAQALRALNPGLVCCSVSGYGQDGPWAQQPAYDATIQAISGVMSITGNGNADSPPVRWGNPIGGIAGALYAVIGVLASLHRRQAGGRGDGGGAWLDISLFQAQLALHAYRVPPAMSGRRYAPDPHRGGSGALPYGPFRAGDGHWFVLAITHQFWVPACEALDHPEWIADARFATEVLRQAHEAELNAQVGQAIATRDAAFWQARFVERGIPGATVLSIREAFDHPQARARGMLAGFAGDHPVGSAVRVAGDPLRFADAPAQGFRPVPGLGEDSQAVLASLLALGGEELSSLRAQRVVWWPESGLVYQRPSVV